MLKKLRRWHFDVMIFVGLGLFTLAYWQSTPTPAWTSYYPQADPSSQYSFSILGYSEDDQSIYTSYEKWPFPQIQRWSTATGELLSDNAFEPTEEEQFLARMPRLHRGYSGYSLSLSEDTRHLLLRFDYATKKDENYMRVFRLDGKPVAHGIELPRFYRVEYLADPDGRDRHWLVNFQLNSRLSELPINVIDLDTRQPVRESTVYTRSKLNAFPLVCGGRLLAFVMKATDDKPMEMEIVDLFTGESKGRIPVAGKYPQLQYIDDTHYAICSLLGESTAPFTTQVHFYRYEPSTRDIVAEDQQPLNGMVSAPLQWLYVHKPCLLQIQGHDRQNTSEIAKTVLGWLARIGIVRNETGPTIKVANLADGQPLRQISNLPSQDYRLDHGCRTLAVHATGPENKPGLSVYVVPHYLWEATLSWVQWLSWLLVFAWPLRYFVGTNRQVISSVPPSANGLQR